jgi:hypothetical protein
MAARRPVRPLTIAPVGGAVTPAEQEDLRATQLHADAAHLMALVHGAAALRECDISVIDLPGRLTAGEADLTRELLVNELSNLAMEASRELARALAARASEARARAERA